MAIWLQPLQPCIAQQKRHLRGAGGVASEILAFEIVAPLRRFKKTGARF
jgi:hypothetical protein